ncbi:MAG: hypothetical protein EBU90_20225 [Proteobacteria bacterium]|nr:hypothetical protein [Pseudomonadota bacterium]
MKIQNTTEFYLSIDDITEAIMRYLNQFHNVPLDSFFTIEYKEVNKTIPSSQYPGDTIDRHVIDGVKIVVEVSK